MDPEKECQCPLCGQRISRAREATILKRADTEHGEAAKAYAAAVTREPALKRMAETTFADAAMMSTSLMGMKLMSLLTSLKQETDAGKVRVAVAEFVFKEVERK